MDFNPVALAKKYPTETAIIAGVGVLGLLYVFGFFGGGSSGGGSNAAADAAYFSAQSAQAQAGDAVQVAQIQANASTAQAAIAGNVSTTNNTTWANADLSTTENNNQAATAVAPFAAQETLYNDLASIAAQPPIVTTKSSSGFFGIGASTKQSVTPNPSATNASDLLSQLITENTGNGFIAGH